MLLTIAVPTYNRASDLALLLDSIATELASADAAEVEVLVISNASTDGTDGVAQEFAARIPALRYLRNDSNIGMQRNFVRALRESQGRYTWMIGDDELVEPGGVRTVLAAIREYATPVLVFNYSSEPEAPGTPFLKLVDNRPVATTVAPLADLVRSHGWLWTLGNLGMVIVETARLQAVDPEPHIVNCFVQAGWYYEALHAQPVALVNSVVFRTRIKSQTENKERWQTDGTLESFYFLLDSLNRFVELGILPPRVPVTFLNACSSNRTPIWNYFLHSIIQRISRGTFQIDDRDWNTTRALIERVDDDALRDSLTAYLDAIRRAVVATRASHENAIWLVNRYHPHLYSGIA